MEGNKTSNGLPTGESTEDIDRYIKEWREFAEPICKAAGLKLAGFDPGLFLTGDNRESITLPTWFVKRINKGLSA